MGLVFDKIKSLFFKKRILDEAEVEKLRNAFKARYHHFKLLLNANNKALDIMAEMEEALHGRNPFGMTHIKAWCTLVSANVWQIIKHLNELAPGKYEELYERFKEIQIKINPFLVKNIHIKDGRLAISLKEINKDLADQVGSKMANLGEIKNRVAIEVSNGFAITAKAYYKFMAHNDLQAEIDRLIQVADVGRIDHLYELSADIQQLVIHGSIPEDIKEAISEQYRLLEKEDGKGVSVAMRSSALGEDLAETSFAGQYRSMLNISKENVFQTYKEIIAGKYGLQAMAYRLNRGIKDEDVAMCVGCISMVDAASGGVIYSKNPMNMQDDTVYINSVWGLPKAVVDGSSATDLFIISRKNPMKIIKREIPLKEYEFVCYSDEGVCRIDITGNKGSLASLADEKVLELARLAIKFETHYGFPQDIEWAIKKDGSTVLLQCRPLKQIGVQKRNKIESPLEKNSDGIILQGGTTAGPGIGVGPVFIIKKDMDVLQFPEGAVLITTQALPRWATVLNRATAVITEQGSITGHLANVAREFGVPAIFGMSHAVDGLKNGQLITVDADTQSIYEGRNDVILKERIPPPKNLMEGSPVLQAAKGASRYIIPLNLIDPDSHEFKPKHCITFHDITRFCHEKVVSEMFRFGKDHHFPERSSKQLFCDVAMQWWILNLDDGFKKEIEGKYIKLEDITSIPMLALWEGIAAVPWEGPPPINGKGLMSVMFEATANTALTPGVRSRYASRNYFMISKNYCSLSSRLGFHFSTIEAMVSERSNENHISFQFMGGAANYERRQKRVLFVKEILEEYDFRVELRKDHLTARIEDREMAFMIDHLKILGYLTIHTRQLDMVMTSVASINYYRSKIIKEIQGML